jgi:hypothetical protein
VEVHLNDVATIILASGLLVYLAVRFRHSLALHIRRDGMSVETRPEGATAERRAVSGSLKVEKTLQDDFRRRQ